MFEWVLNTPLKTFVILFHSSFLINISSRSYLCISNSMYKPITFIAKKKGIIETSILFKPFKFLIIIIFNDNN